MSGPPEVLLFTDGACLGNPGPGGWACILRHVATRTERRLSGGHPHTTNNRMELTAVIAGLEALRRPGLRVQVVTDSQYVARGMTEWLPHWRARGWRRGRGGPGARRGGGGSVKNVDLWRRLADLVEPHEVEFVHVAGHAGHPENEECDQMSVAAAQAAAAGHSEPAPREEDRFE